MFRFYMKQTMKNNKSLWGTCICIGTKLEQLGHMDMYWNILIHQ